LTYPANKQTNGGVNSEQYLCR